LSNADLRDLARVTHDLTVRTNADRHRHSVIDNERTEAAFAEAVGAYSAGTFAGSVIYSSTVQVGDIVGFKGSGSYRLGIVRNVHRIRFTVEYQPLTAEARTKVITPAEIVAHQSVPTRGA
jgi:hypothetical protein